MKRRAVAFLAVLAAMFTMSTTALAFDCMRVSSSLQGLEQSTRSGNWLVFNMTDGGGGIQQLFTAFTGTPLTQSQLDCFQAAYDASSAPRYFALGIGVAGARANQGPMVLAHRAPEQVLMNGTGIDHLDATVLPVLGANLDCLNA